VKGTAEFDFDEALMFCRLVRKDLQEMLDAVKDRSFYDIGYEIGQLASAGEAFRSMFSEFDELEKHLKAKDLQSIESMDWSSCGLINHYDELYDRIMARGEHYKKDVEILDKLKRWRKNASILAQIICQMDE